jgi:hypothetical protein
LGSITTKRNSPISPKASCPLPSQLLFLYVFLQKYLTGLCYQIKVTVLSRVYIGKLMAKVLMTVTVAVPALAGSLGSITTKRNGPVSPKASLGITF